MGCSDVVKLSSVAMASISCTLFDLPEIFRLSVFRFFIRIRLLFLIKRIKKHKRIKITFSKRNSVISKKIFIKSF